MTKRVTCALLSGILVVGNMGLSNTGLRDAGQRAVGLGSFVGYGTEPPYAGASAVGPRVRAAVGTSDSLDQEVADPTARLVDRYSYEQMEADIQSPQNTYGGKISIQITGTSLDGRNVYGIVLGNPDAKTQILIQEATHTGGHMTPLVMMGWLEYTLVFYETGCYNYKSIPDMLQKMAIHLIPMTSPGGVTLGQFGADAIRGQGLKQGIMDCYAQGVSLGRISDSFEIYLTKWEANAADVDLNYNFPYGWEDLFTTLATPSYAVYKGTAPFSELESRALFSLAEQYPQAITISCYSQGKVIYWTTNSNGAEMAPNTLAEAISIMIGYSMDFNDGGGGFRDWMQSRNGAVLRVTLEVGKTPCPVPFSEYSVTWQQNEGVRTQALDHVDRRI